MSNKPPAELADIRSALADYIWSEGCSCCRGADHDKHLVRLARLLRVEVIDDKGTEWADFYKYREVK